MMLARPRVPGPPGVTWVDVQELPPTAAERRRDGRLFTTLDLVFYGIIVAVTFYITYPAGVLTVPLYLSAYLVMLAGFGALFYRRHRVRSASLGRNPYADRSRIGSSPASLYIEDFTGRREVPWVEASAPRIEVWRGRQFYSIPYRNATGEVTQLRLTAARMTAVLGSPYRPEWVLSETVLRALEAEYRARAVPLPHLPGRP